MACEREGVVLDPMRFSLGAQPADAVELVECPDGLDEVGVRHRNRRCELRLSDLHGHVDEALVDLVEEIVELRGFCLERPDVGILRWQLFCTGKVSSEGFEHDAFGLSLLRRHPFLLMWLGLAWSGSEHDNETCLNLTFARWTVPGAGRTWNFR